MVLGRLSILCLAFLALMSRVSGQEDTANADQIYEKIEGTWAAESVVASGEALPKELATQLRWTFVDRKTLVVQQMKGGEKDHCPFSLDVTTSPISFQFTPPGEKLNPPRPKDAKQEAHVLGILKFDGEALVVTICRRTKTPVRPAKFRSTQESDTIQLRFNRVSNTEAPAIDGQGGSQRR
jgi:uncharacterized protein (TIGR03067 family)